MIYMDNAATSLQKPLQVEQAVLEALRTAGNPGRGAHEATLHASRLVYGARAAAAELFDAEDASRIAFTANATEALNIAISGLIRPGDHVITTVCEHYSVLRPLYRLRDQGATLSFVGVDARGNLKYEELEAFLRPETRAVVITGASNVTGNVTDLSYISSFVKRNGLLLIVDASQTAGEELFSVQKLGIDVLCFTGHKALLGPQGTGGLYVKPGLSVEPLLVGGSGIHSYDEHHPKEMPTALEAARFARSCPITYASSCALIWCGAGTSFIVRNFSASFALLFFLILFFSGISVFGICMPAKSLRFMFINGIF